MPSSFYNILFFLIPNFIFAQQKEYFYDANNHEISRKEYKKIKENHKKNLKLTFVSDTAIIHTVELRNNEGVLTEVAYQELIRYINTIVDKKTDSSKTIIVNYYPGMDVYNSSGNKDFVNAKYLNFLQALESKKNVSQYFFYKSPEGTEHFDKRIKWYPDIKGHIELHYFPRHYPCGSYLIVYPNRTYFLYKGEYDILEILKQI